MSISLRLAGAAEGRSAEAAGPSAERPPFLPERPFPTGSKPPPLPGKGHKILVADDNEIVLKAFEMKLRAKGFIVSTTTDSGSVASMLEQARAELIILDVNFPTGNAGAVEWNGFMIVQWLRRFPDLAKIPVILISGCEAAQYEDKALKAGAVAFFHKPLDLDELTRVILATLDKP